VKNRRKNISGFHINISRNWHGNLREDIKELLGRMNTLYYNFNLIGTTILLQLGHKRHSPYKKLFCRNDLCQTIELFLFLN